jgi:hypothetical protein
MGGVNDNICDEEKMKVTGVQYPKPVPTRG